MHTDPKETTSLRPDRTMNPEIAIIQLIAAVLTLVSALLALMPTLGSAIRHITKKRRKR